MSEAVSGIVKEHCVGFDKGKQKGSGKQDKGSDWVKGAKARTTGKKIRVWRYHAHSEVLLWIGGVRIFRAKGNSYNRRD